jgi:hypothetical protein
MYVTRISRYIESSLLSSLSRNRGTSWNVLPVATGALMYSELCVVREKERGILENTKSWRGQVRFELGRKRHCDKVELTG